jgi:hypothetical protein
MPSFSVGLRALLRLEVAAERLDQRLADQQLAEVLQVGQRIQREEPLHQRIGMLHLADRLSYSFLAMRSKPQCLNIR